MKIDMNEDTQEQKLKKDWMWTFTKRIVAFVCIIFTIIFFVGLLESIYALLKFNDTAFALTIFTETCTIFRDMIISYCVKAGVENYQKIKKLFTEGV